MAMEILGGNLPAGRPAAVFAGGRTHVFAIGAGGMMNHWTSSNGIDWQGPDELPRLSTNIVPSYPCAIALGNAVHVFAINNGGSLVRWFSPDGITFFPPFEDSTWTIPADNGLAASSPSGSNRIDAFAVTTDQGLVRYSWDNIATSPGTPLGSAPLPPSLVPGNLPRCVPAAVTSATNVTDVFAVGPDGSALRWRSTDGFTWAISVLPRPAAAPPTGPLVRSGFAAVSPAAGQIELFAVTTGAKLAHWSIDGANVTATDFLPSPPMPINDGVPVAIVVDGRIEVFAIGNPLVRWRRRVGGTWSEPKLIDASLPAGGLAAAITNNGRIDVFGVGGDGLQHWPAGIGAASNEPWSNWANNRQFNPVRHCRPSTEEEVAAIVKTAEKTAGVRVRAVGSSWSFTDITVPTAPGVIVETNQMDGLITHVIDRSVLTENAPDPRYLIHVEAGIQVERLMEILDAMDLAPFTMGGASGQTLAGVISTSVHGSNWDRGPIPNAVRAIQLVGPGGVRHWLEPDQWRITREDELRTRLGPDVRIRYDDDWFDAVLVSMGSMGIITSVVLEVTNQYSLEKACKELTWSELEPRLDPYNAETVFDLEHQYVMVAIDPANPATCYLTTHKRTNLPATPSGGWFSDPLAAYCGVDPEKVVLALLAFPLIDAAIVPAFAAIGLPVPPPAATAGILAAALRAGPPGTVANFLGAVFNSNAGLAAEFVSWMTRFTLKPGQSSVDVAHKIMAPVNRAECLARGLAIELAFDTSSGSHVAFIKQATAVLNTRRAEGMVLGGYIALRFVGPSRAILSPQQSARTCMIEITGVKSMNSAEPLLNELEQLGSTYGAIQHWGMFGIPNLSAADLPRAYPRLDTWRRVRREITNGGTTFENDFTARLGLDAPPAGTPLVWQQDWKWCSKCLGMAYAGGAPGPCAAGGTHDHSASGNYGFAHNAPWVPGQRRWRWCSKCMGMTLGNEFAAPCPAGGAHDLSSSGEYTILRNGEADWKWCDKCQGLAFARGAPGPCPAGGVHNHPIGGSGYWLAFAPLVAPPTPAPAPPSVGTIASATVPTLGLGAGSAVGAAFGAPPELHVVLLTPLLARQEQAHSSPEVPGERGWRRCSRCQGLTKVGGKCAGDVPHQHDAPLSYVIPLNAPTVPGQAHWRLCTKCQTLAFRTGVCFDGGAHDLTGSGDYALRTAGQNAWRHCKHCNGLWFSGNGGQGRCPSPAGVHDLGTDDYVIAPKS
jgi:hypothetical protein